MLVRYQTKLLIANIRVAKVLAVLNKQLSIVF